VIGDQGGLPWSLPSDLKQFKAITMGKPVIMGRKTWESLPKKPLPGRRNIVLTRDPDFREPGASTAHSLTEAVAAADDAEEICVIGGAEVFQLFSHLAQRIYLTRVLAEVAGDTKMPEIDMNVWREVRRSAPQRSEKDSAAFETAVLERR